MINGLYGAMLLDELLRFTTQQAGWPSVLLRQSTIGLMEELALASRQTANGVLSPSSFDDVKSQTHEQLLRDPGLGSMQKRGPLLDLIPRGAREFGPSSYKCKAWMLNLPPLKTSYISKWRTELRSAAYADSSGPRFPTAIPANDVAAFVASYLLYLGMSSGYLSRWFNYRVQHDPAAYSLDQIFEHLEDLVSNGSGEFNILVPLVRPAQEEIRSLQGWLDGKSARKWLADHRLPAPRSIHGAITFTVDAWDLDGAVLKVAKSLHSLRQRMLLKTGRAPAFDTAAWIVGVTDPRRMPPISQMGPPELLVTRLVNRVLVLWDPLIALKSQWSC
jgi:hypothetical protein